MKFLERWNVAQEIIDYLLVAIRIPGFGSELFKGFLLKLLRLM